MLLYHTVDYELDQTYKMSGNNLYVKIVNLGTEFDKIKNKLLNIAVLYVNDVLCGYIYFAIIIKI